METNWCGEWTERRISRINGLLQIRKILADMSGGNTSELMAIDQMAKTAIKHELREASDNFDEEI